MEIKDLKYFNNRATPFIGMDNSKLEAALLEIENYFGKNWLNKNKNHPLVELWKRNDFLSTNELYALGYSIGIIKHVDEKWLKQQINLIKVGDVNNRKGAFFEITGLALLAYKNKILFSIENQPGYDATLMFKNERIFRISMKNYGLSVHNKDFISKSEKLKNLSCSY